MQNKNNLWKSKLRGDCSMSEIERIFVGTYTIPILFGTGEILEGKGKGIYCIEMDTKTGELVNKGLVQEVINPSYFCISQDKKYLYTVNELKEYNGQAGGSVSSYLLGLEEGELTYINTQSTKGTDPCHITINEKATCVYVTNFMSGSVAVFPIMSDGSLGSMSQFFQHEGSSINPLRQKGPHAHSLFFDQQQKHAFVPDLGTDKLMIYGVDDKGLLKQASKSFYQFAPGEGPRYGEFDSCYHICYIINELNSDISVLAYDSEKEDFTLLQSINTIPEAEKQNNTSADLHITPDGKYLYASNRGHNSLSMYKVSQGNGTLDFIGNISCGGKTPRNFTVDLTGNYLIVSNQDSNNVISFRIDHKNGRINKCYEIYIPTPVFVKPLYVG